MRPSGNPDKNHVAKTSVENVRRLTLAFAAAASRRQKDKSDNLVVSPYNALATLSMAAAGAQGETRRQMAQTLYGVPCEGLDQAMRDYADLNEKILSANKGKVELTTANGVWVKSGDLTLSRDYQKALGEIFKTSASLEDFASPATVKKINKWASDNTKGLIPQVLDRIDPASLSVLASALYFKGAWTRKFDKKKTEDAAFTQDGAASVVTAMMNQDFSRKGDIRYLETEDYQGVSMTYGEADAKKKQSPGMRITLVRPRDPQVSARTWLEGEADNTGSAPWLDDAAFRPVRGHVALPHLDIKQTHDLIPALVDMGIRDAFRAERADFSGMTREQSKDVFIGKVSHDVVFKTDEEGSEGAAVTVVGMVRSTSFEPPESPVDIRFDRSFVFVVSDIATGTPVFIGAVNKPNDKLKPSAGPSVAR